LPLESFKGYLVQDYLYLVSPLPLRGHPCAPADPRSQIHFARANALASYKAKSMADIAAVSPGYLHVTGNPTNRDTCQSAEIVSHIFREMQLHITYCEGFGISREEIEKTEEKMGETSPRDCSNCHADSKQPALRTHATSLTSGSPKTGSGSRLLYCPAFLVTGSWQSSCTRTPGQNEENQTCTGHGSQTM